MGRLSLEALKTGMTVRADVVDRTGRLLMPSGTRLEEKHLRRLRVWGISDVEAEHGAKEDPDSGPQLQRPLSEEEEERLRVHFRHNDPDHPLIRELLAHARLRVSLGPPEKSRQ
jgi:hypothetical protein